MRIDKQEEDRLLGILESKNNKKSNVLVSCKRNRPRQRKPRNLVIKGAGPDCWRCGQPTEIREHREITERERRKPFFYLRWYKCANPACRTELIMPPEFRMFRDDDARRAYEFAPRCD